MTYLHILCPIKKDKMMNIKQSIIAFAFIGSIGVSAQTVNESEVIISEENLISLIQKIKEKKEQNRVYTQLNESNNTKVSSDFIASKSTNNTTNTSADFNKIHCKLIALEYEIKHLNLLLSNQQNKNLKKDLVVINAPKKEKDETLAKKIDSLQLLYTQNLENKEAVDKKNKRDDLERKYDELLLKLTNSKSTKDTLIIKNNDNSNYLALVKKYGNFKKQVFFENNSKNIDSKQYSDIEVIISILNNNEKIDVYLKGFASKKGNPIYNENLSLQRTESIKKYLITKGIHPSRILTQYHGIDYSVYNEENARRVDITLIIRK